MGADMNGWVYILYSQSRNRYYIGQTVDIKNRMREHLTGSTCSTKGVTDWNIVFLQTTAGRKEAMQLESVIKRKKSRHSIARFIEDKRNEIQQSMSLNDFISGCSAAW